MSVDVTTTTLRPVLLARRADNTTKGYPDIVINDFISNTKIQYDPKSASISKTEVSFSYVPHPRKFISLTHVDKGSDRNIELSGAYPITNRVHIFAGIDKSLSAGVINKETSGVAYESCCWAARIAHFKEAVTDDIPNYDYSTGLELVFKGLGTIDSQLRNHIEDNLPEYKVSLD